MRRGRLAAGTMLLSMFQGCKWLERLGLLWASLFLFIFDAKSATSLKTPVAIYFLGLRFPGEDVGRDTLAGGLEESVGLRGK